MAAASVVLEEYGCIYLFVVDTSPGRQLVCGGSLAMRVDVAQSLNLASFQGEESFGIIKDGFHIYYRIVCAVGDADAESEIVVRQDFVAAFDLDCR